MNRSNIVFLYELKSSLLSSLGETEFEKMLYLFKHWLMLRNLCLLYFTRILTHTHTHTKLILNSHKKHSNTNKYNKCQLSRLIDPFSLNCVCKFRFSPQNCTYSVTLATHYSTPTQCVPYIVHVNLCYHEQDMHVCASKTLNKNVIYA